MPGQCARGSARRAPFVAILRDDEKSCPRALRGLTNLPRIRGWRPCPYFRAGSLSAPSAVPALVWPALARGTLFLVWSEELRQSGLPPALPSALPALDAPFRLPVPPAHRPCRRRRWRG